jgi:multidrug efflux pump subunit AcrA (membrane-fusion protein)
MSVEANVVTREKPEALLIPSDALQGTSVFVIEGRRMRRRTIELGIRGTRAVEVLSGLAANEQVASPAPAALADGRRVRVTAKPEAAP